ncbi:MAG: Uridine phosphorylase [Actinomycetota bacterium]|jgi:uridine phosphorylase
MSTKQHHLHLESGDVGRYVLLPGDPGRVEVIAKHLDDAVHVATNREYVTYTGYLDGVKVSVTSTGIGCPSAAIAIEELARVGADTFIRVGTSGGIQPGTQTGDLAIVSGAIRDEGTSSHYMPIEFPAVADIEIVQALRKAAISQGRRYRVGITQSKDSFYGEVEPEHSGVTDRLLNRWKAWEIGGAICSEMEAAALFVIASMLRVRAGGIMVMVTDGSLLTLDPLIETAIEGVRELIKGDNHGKQ